jgi:hypothetical protein
VTSGAVLETVFIIYATSSKLVLTGEAISIAYLVALSRLFACFFSCSVYKILALSSFSVNFFTALSNIP